VTTEKEGGGWGRRRATRARRSSELVVRQRLTSAVAEGRRWRHRPKLVAEHLVVSCLPRPLRQDPGGRGRHSPDLGLGRAPGCRRHSLSPSARKGGRVAGGRGRICSAVVCLCSGSRLPLLRLLRLPHRGVAGSRSSAAGSRSSLGAHRRGWGAAAVVEAGPLRKSKRRWSKRRRGMKEAVT
jgi:hypothetical protein